ncbi:hypothetical protein ACFVYR_25395 [Streptomyces sp. NPDC058284]|uniref:hypothetical protein n=1 Tax=unclassified Streptomyces TaxID=2593676 RepID=UPI00364AA07F
MSDIRIDFAFLARVREDLRHVTDIMKRPGREMDDVDGVSMGVPELSFRMNDFGDEWSYGIKQIGKYSEAAVKTLTKMEKAFEDVDEKLAHALERAKKDGSR